MKRKMIRLLAAVFMIAVMITPVKAESVRTYMVRISAGLYGVFSDGSDEIVLNVEYNASFDQQQYIEMITVTDDHYYVIDYGMHVTGQQDTPAPTRITGDIDLVVSYGVTGDQVAYFVSYVDTEGNPLLETLTFHGTEGDKPVIAYRYIEGYQPQFEIINEEIHEGSHFVFVYKKVETSTKPTSAAPSVNPLPLSVSTLPKGSSVTRLAAAYSRGVTAVELKKAQPAYQQWELFGFLGFIGIIAVFAAGRKTNKNL